MTSIIHVDGGANSYTFRDRNNFWKYNPYKNYITQVAGTTTPLIGMGIVPITFPGSNHLYLLYSSYHMPDNPQDTICIPALKYYNQCRSTKVKALAWFIIVSKEGYTITVPTIPMYHKQEPQDYVSIIVYKIYSNITTEQNA